MKKNNFNCNCNGISVEIVAFYDTDLSRIYFEDNFISEKNERSLFYIGGDHCEDDFKIEITDTLEKLSDCIGWDKEELDYRGVTEVSELEYELFYDCKTIDDKLTLLVENNISYDANFEVIISRGYSQGDKRAVFVLKSDEYVTRDHIDNLLWDCPITCRLSINGNDEFFEDDFLDDFYTWDYDAVIQKISGKLSAYNEDEKAEILSVIPKTLDYI